MNVDLMRKVDHFAGVPLCFAGTIVRKLGALFSAPKAGSAPRKVLLIELSEMGSTILADPAMEKLKRELKVELFFAIFRKNRPSLELLGTVPDGNIYTIDESSFSSFIADTVRFFSWTRRNGIDTVIDMELFSRFTALLAGFSGARRVVGFHAFHNEGLYRGDFLTHRVAYNPHQHMAKNFIALANAVLCGCEEVTYSKIPIADEEMLLRTCVISDEAKETMRRRVSTVCPAYRAGKNRIVLFNANASDLLPIRRWPREHYIALGRILLERYPDVVILLTGGREDHAWLEAISSALASPRCVNFSGRTHLAELPALYAVSAFMLSNDSGPPHFASVTTMPMFVFFGPETPNLYLPLGNATPIYAGLACSPCVSASNHRKTACTDNVCLQVITPARVFDLLQPVLRAVTAPVEGVAP